MNRYSKLRGSYHFAPIISKLKANGWKNEDIANLIGCSISTIKYSNKEVVESNNLINEEIGEPCFNKVHVAALFKCQEIFAVRDWTTSIVANPESQFDIIAFKNDKLKKIQVRSSYSFSNRGFPSFRLKKYSYGANNKLKEKSYVKGDFDYWFFYSSNNDCWLIPFDNIESSDNISMEGYEQFSTTCYEIKKEII